MDLAAIRELEALKDAFVPRPGNQRFRFHYLFLNVVDDPAQRVKPPGPHSEDSFCRRKAGRGETQAQPVVQRALPGLKEIILLYHLSVAHQPPRTAPCRTQTCTRASKLFKPGRAS